MNEFDIILKDIRKNIRSLGLNFTRILLECYYVLDSSNTSMLDKTIIIIAMGYQVVPNQVLSKKIGLLGYIDNIAMILLAYNRIKHNVTSNITIQVEKKINEWF